MNKYYCQYVYQVPQGYSSTISFIESIETKYFGRQLSDIIFLGLHGALVNKKNYISSLQGGIRLRPIGLPFEVSEK